MLFSENKEIKINNQQLTAQIQQLKAEIGQYQDNYQSLKREHALQEAEMDQLKAREKKY